MTKIDDEDHKMHFLITRDIKRFQANLSREQQKGFLQGFIEYFSAICKWPYHLTRNNDRSTTKNTGEICFSPRTCTKLRPWNQFFSPLINLKEIKENGDIKISRQKLRERHLITYWNSSKYQFFFVSTGFSLRKAKQEPNEKEFFNCLLMGIFQIGIFLNELFSCPNILGLKKEIFPLIQTAKRKGCQYDSSIFWYLSFGFM